MLEQHRVYGSLARRGWEWGMELGKVTRQAGGAAQVRKLKASSSSLAANVEMGNLILQWGPGPGYSCTGQGVIAHSGLGLSQEDTFFGLTLPVSPTIYLATTTRGRHMGPRC